MEEECTEEKRLCTDRGMCLEIGMSQDKYRYGCTRKKGHLGSHVACGVAIHNCFTWQNEGAKEEVDNDHST